MRFYSYVSILMLLCYRCRHAAIAIKKGLHRLFTIFNPIETINIIIYECATVWHTRHTTPCNFCHCLLKIFVIFFIFIFLLLFFIIVISQYCRRTPFPAACYCFTCLSYTHCATQSLFGCFQGWLFFEKITRHNDNLNFHFTFSNARVICRWIFTMAITRIIIATILLCLL